MEKLKPAPFGLLALFVCAWPAVPVQADKLVLKDGALVYGTITDEKDSLIKYFDRFERPRKIASSRVDTIHYDSRQVNGLVKVAFRKGQPKDRSGYFRLRHSEELDLEVEYKTDSLSELDLFFRSNVHLRVPPNSHFKVLQAPKSAKGAIELELYQGRILVASSGREAVTRVITPWGIAVGRGHSRFAARASQADSSVLAICLDGLVGLQETPKSPGELVVEKGQSTTIFKRAGVFERGEPNPAEVGALVAQSANMAHYQFSDIAYPKIGYLPKAITGLGFMVFFYGSAIGILNYVNHI